LSEGWRESKEKKKKHPKKTKKGPEQRLKGKEKRFKARGGGRRESSEKKIPRESREGPIRSKQSRYSKKNKKIPQRGLT